MLNGVDTGHRREAQRREHRLSDGHVPDRRTRDDERPPLLRDLSPAQEPASPPARRARPSTRCSATKRRASSISGELRFIEQILMEALRLWPTAAAFAVKPIAPTRLAGKYELQPHEDILVVLRRCCIATRRYGATTSRLSGRSGSRRKMPSGCRRTPGSPSAMAAAPASAVRFAMQEAQLVLAMMLQRFDIVFDDPAYQLEIKETLTIKPHGLKIRARPRRERAIRPRERGSDDPAKIAEPAGRQAVRGCRRGDRRCSCSTAATPARARRSRTG